MTSAILPRKLLLATALLFAACPSPVRAQDIAGVQAFDKLASQADLDKTIAAGQ